MAIGALQSQSSNIARLNQATPLSLLFFPIPPIPCAIKQDAGN